MSDVFFLYFFIARLL